MKNKAFVLLKIVLLCLVMIMTSSVTNAQMLSLDTCLQIFAADSSTLQNLRLDEDFTTENLSNNAMFVKQFKSKTDKRVSMMKLISTDTTRKQLLYNFRSDEQYARLREELQSGKFERVESHKQIIEGKVNIKDTYRLKDTWITIRKEENDKSPDTKHSLFIGTLGKS